MKGNFQGKGGLDFALFPGKSHINDSGMAKAKGKRTIRY
jgi:hypothetical protein